MLCSSPKSNGFEFDSLIGFSYHIQRNGRGSNVVLTAVRVNENRKRERERDRELCVCGNVPAARQHYVTEKCIMHFMRGKMTFIVSTVNERETPNGDDEGDDANNFDSFYGTSCHDAYCALHTHRLYTINFYLYFAQLE